MIRPSKADRAYAAGLVDGEGAISIFCRGQGRPQYVLSVEITQRNPTVLLWLRERWGGTLALYGPYGKQARAYWRWRLNPRPALAFLVDIRPWLVLKQSQADVAIAYQRARPTAKTKHGRAVLTVLEGREARAALVALRQEGTA